MILPKLSSILNAFCYMFNDFIDDAWTGNRERNRHFTENAWTGNPERNLQFTEKYINTRQKSFRIMQN